MRRNKELSKGVLAGVIGGLAGAWVMNQYSSVLQKVQEAWKKSAHEPDQGRQQNRSDEDDATTKTADRIAELVANRHLTKEEKKKAGPIVHYAYGAVLGGIYGAMAELSPMVTKGTGTAYAFAVWLAGDEIAVPALGLSAPPNQYPLKVHANALASHIVYGTTTEIVRRTVRHFE